MCIRDSYGDVADFLETTQVGEPLPQEADAIVVPQMIFAAFRHDEALKAYKVPMVVLTSRFGTVEMWDWEIVTYLRDVYKRQNIRRCAVCWKMFSMRVPA